ncbi:MAG TPA: alkaline phosphatase family protein [Methanocella sp.]
MQAYRAAFAAFILLLSCVAAGCVNSSTQWTMTINGDSAYTINNSVYTEIQYSNATVNGTTGVPLEEFLYGYGLYPVTSVSIGGHTYNWSWLATTTDRDQPVLVMPNGSIFDGQSFLKTDNIVVNMSEKPTYSSLNIEPSLLYALGLGGNGTLITNKSDRIVLFYVDAFGYDRYQWAKSKGIISNITSLGEPLKIACVYPSVSIVNSKTLVSGIPPNASKGELLSYFPDGPTILQIAGQHGLNACWIDGKTQPVNLGDYTINRPDVDKNGYEADEVTAEALQKYGNEANLIFVHFKDTDSVMHASGPYSDESMAAIKFADEQIGRMLPFLDPGTMVIIYADHGGHKTFDGGNHGTLIPEDMIIPFIVHIV